MWSYEKRLEHPVNIKNPDPKLAQAIITQFGGPDCLSHCKTGGDVIE